MNDALPISKIHSYTTNGEIFQGRAGQRLLVVRAYFPHLCWAVGGGVFSFSLQMFISFFLFQGIAQFLSDPTQPFWWGMVLVVIMLVTSIIQNFVFAFTWVQGCSLGIKLKSGFFYTVYNKAIRLRDWNENSGFVLNMLSNDAERMFELGNYLIWSLASPFLLVGSIILLHIILGWSASPLIALWAVLVLAQKLISFRISQLRFKVKRAFAKFCSKKKLSYVFPKILPKTDKRVGLISELVNYVKVINHRFSFPCPILFFFFRL